MNIQFHTSSSVVDRENLSPCLYLLLAKRNIPNNARRLVFNFRARRFYSHQQGHPPVEIHIERECPESPWQVIVIACFGYVDETCERLDVDLYFNLKRGWIYQPLTKQCNLLEPSALSLLESFSGALAKSITKLQFDDISLLVSRTF